MRVNLLTLCDAGSVRENLVGLLGAGVTLFQPPSYPTQMQADLAIQLAAAAVEIGPHTVQLSITGPGLGSSKELMNGALDLNIGEPGTPGGTFRTFSLVLNLSEVLIPEPGDYVIRASVDGGDPVEYGFTSAGSVSISTP